MPFISNYDLGRLKERARQGDQATQRAKDYERELAIAFVKIKSVAPDVGHSLTDHMPAMYTEWGSRTAELPHFVEEWLEDYKEQVAKNRAVCVTTSMGGTAEHRPASHWSVHKETGALIVYLGRRVIAQHTEYTSVYYKEGAN